jgi:putative restriction endonuclease
MLGAGMRKYWWVNHKRTVVHEVQGGYLWAPKVKKNGDPSQFYKNMRVASPGDFVLSFANGEVKFVGQVQDFALSSPKPNTFGAAGDSWSDDGWRLPVAWRTLTNPVRPKSFIHQLGPLLPSRYSPMHASSGNGNQAAYLAEISFEAFQIVLEKAGVDLDLAMASPELANIFGDAGEELDAAVERQLEMSKALSETDKIQVIKARRGQGLFRSNVQLREQLCRLTGVSSLYLLVASHIKPWRSCANSFERLDGNNGLLLTPHVDLLFDRGLISFSDEGGLIVSTRMDSEDLLRLGLGRINFPTHPFTTEQRFYLDYHRANVLLS